MFRFSPGVYIEYDGSTNLIIETSHDAQASGIGGKPYVISTDNIRTVSAGFERDKGPYPFEKCGDITAAYKGTNLHRPQHLPARPQRCACPHVHACMHACMHVHICTSMHTCRRLHMHG